MKQLQVSRHHYAYKVHQHKKHLPYLLMLHGFMGDHRAFDHLVPYLTSFCNPVAVDLLGFGQSSQPTKAVYYRDRRQSGNLLELIEKLQLSSLYLYGYSMGGRLALQTVVANTIPFQGLVLESTTCGITEEQKRKERKELDYQWAQQVISDYSGFLAEWKKLPLFDSPLPVDKARAERYEKMQAGQNPRALAASLKGFGTGSMRPVCSELSTVSIPTLVMAGSADEKYMQSSPSLADRLPNGEFSAVEAGHRVHLDNPSGLTSRIRHLMTKII